MRITAIAGLFACMFIINASTQTASAEALRPLELDKTTSTSTVAVLTAIETVAEPKPVEPVKVEPVKHVVVANDILAKIAEQYQTTWLRLYAKNPTITNPDLIKVGDEIIVPLPEEVLPERPLPVPVAPAPAQPVARQNAAPVARTAVVAQGSSAGNRYTAGYCTWYAKNRRPDLPNNLGNANTWVSRAAAQGLPTGSAPRVGAIGQQGMHVVYVESVNGDGTVTISEMNWNGLYVISSRTVAASNFSYIY